MLKSVKAKHLQNQFINIFLIKIKKIYIISKTKILPKIGNFIKF